ncbi:hypothetical protein CBM2615_B140099 [Cupriavidus taiwanensis]|nr:hypothetical protein CBM2614_B150042 [Cupriavidus taiwanensis]SOZ64185.1 hypothetical protein CBM2615_B140099 [Cupriavidus taiwanensis]SPA07825.1 hypothetical protein CBM2625_B110100 [Cupriavidus taiwanensis]
MGRGLIGFHDTFNVAVQGFDSFPPVYFSTRRLNKSKAIMR